MRCHLIAAIWTLAGLGAAAPAIAAQVAGYISAIDGRNGECLIARGRKTVEARYWADLLVGDQVIAKGECRIEIMPKDGPRRWLVMSSNSPAVMAEPARRQSPLPPTLDPLGLALTSWNDELWPPLPPPPPPRAKRAKGKAIQAAPPVAAPEAKKAAPAMPKDERLRLALFRDPVPQQFVAAPRRLNLAWTGGKPPFTVTIAPKDDHTGTAPPWIFQIGEERIVSSMIAPRPGEYVAKITDTIGSAVEGRFVVVETPPGIDRGDLGALPPEIQAIVAAARIANYEGGIWRLEAHAQLAELGRADYAAALMAARLRDGKDVPAPQVLNPANTTAMTTAVSGGQKR